MTLIKTLLAATLALASTLALAAVDANKASQAELESIKGVGPSISTRIIDERKKNPFKDWQDMLDRVKGVGDGNAARFSAEGLTLNGAAFAGGPAKSAGPAAARKNDKPKANTDEKKAAATSAPANAVAKK